MRVSLSKNLHMLSNGQQLLCEFTLLFRYFITSMAVKAQTQRGCVTLCRTNVLTLCFGETRQMTESAETDASAELRWLQPHKHRRPADTCIAADSVPATRKFPEMPRLPVAAEHAQDYITVY